MRGSVDGMVMQSNLPPFQNLLNGSDTEPEDSQIPVTYLTCLQQLKIVLAYLDRFLTWIDGTL